MTVRWTVRRVARVSNGAGRRDGSPPAREKRTIEVKLLGRGFTVRSDDDEAYVRELVEFANRKLHDLQTATGRIETEQVALLAVLDLADALFRERRRGEALRRGVRDRSKTLLGAIDEMARNLEAPEVVALAGRLARSDERAPGL